MPYLLFIYILNLISFIHFFFRFYTLIFYPYTYLTIVPHTLYSSIIYYIISREKYLKNFYITVILI